MMHRSILQWCLVVLFGALAAATALAATSGLGGTGQPVRKADGIGGTGHSGGIGGTGIDGEGGISGTGIIGIVRGGDDSGIGGTGILAGKRTVMIRVGGIDVSLTSNADIAALQTGLPARLAPGQVVMIESFDTGSRVVAAHVRIVHAVTGPISQVSTRGDLIRVLGQTIRIHRNTRITDSHGNQIGNDRLRPGQAVAVSGLRNSEGVIQATRILLLDRIQHASVFGVVSRVDDTGIHIQGLTLDSSRKDIKPGQRVHVHGAIVNGRMHPVEIIRLPDIAFGGRFKRIILEGIASGKPAADGLIRVSSLQVHMHKTTRVVGGRLHRDAFVRVLASPRGGHLDADRIVIERPGPLPAQHERPEPVRGVHRDHERPDMERHDNDKPEMEKPEMEKPETEKPEMDKPEMERPEMEKREME